LIKILHNPFKRNRFVLLILYLSSFFAAQRFLLYPFDAYFCFIPFLLSLIYFNDPTLRNTLLILSLFLSVDNAVEDLAITFGALRYSIYILSIYSLYKTKYFDSKSIFVFGFIIVFYLLNTLIHIVNIDWATFTRDIILLGLVFPVFCSDSKKSKFSIDFYLLCSLILFFLFSELANLFIRPFMGYDSSDYLSYNSSKSLIIIPSIFYLINKNYRLGLTAVIITIVILIAYSTRMIIITYVITLFLIFLSNVRLKNILYIFLFVISTFFILNESRFEPEQFKASSVFIQLFKQGDLVDKVVIIDPVRFYETKLFFSRNIFSILFGDGFGSGLIDSNNELNFVKLTDTAFSLRELSTGHYYNLHDTWTDLGLRFGLLVIILIYIQLFRLVLFGKSKIIQSIAAILFIIFSCATFSTQGLIILSFLFYSIKSECEIYLFESRKLLFKSSI
jgi:hypothetical protein